MKQEQLDFRDLGPPKGKDQSNASSALDEMFALSRKYRSSLEYRQLLGFISKFRRYAPFNCLLMHIQDPDVDYVATAGDWMRRFGRRPMRRAKPLVILQPFGPVMFLYDVKDTEGEPFPQSLLKPFDTQGTISPYTFAMLARNCKVHGIDVRIEHEGILHAGTAIRLTPEARRYFSDLKPKSTSKYLILLNRRHTLEQKFETLAHELGHIFCGHLGIDAQAWWQSETRKTNDVMEIEAESVSYLVCLRQGVKASAVRYISQYLEGPELEIPPFGLSAVLQATDYIEKMSESVWREPFRKPSRIARAFVNRAQH